MIERVPPHNIEAEEAVLGAMLLSRDAIAAAAEQKLAAADFYKPAHSHIFTAIVSLNDQGESADPTTVANELARVDLLDNLGGRQALLRLQAGTPASANAIHYAKIVSELALLRRLIGVGGEIAELGFDTTAEPIEVLDRAETLVFDVAERHVTDSIVRLPDAYEDAVESLDADPASITGVATGYTDLDHLLLGLQPSTMVTLAARPSMGKTACALGMAMSSARHGNPTIFFSMEMGARELTYRLLSAEAEIPLRNLQQRRLDQDAWANVQAAIGATAKVPLYIDDNPHCSIAEMRAKARRIAARHQGTVGLIVVDYIQLMTPPPSGRRTAENRQVEVAEMSRGLKLLARELVCPVVALAQLNRNVEYRADKRPMLADLRDSGALEQDSDVVIGLFREEVYDAQTENRGTAEVLVLKNRNGPTGNARLTFRAPYAQFVNMAKGEG